MNWYGWTIELASPELQRDMLGPDVDSAARRVRMLRSRVVLATTNEKRYIVANAAVRHLVERTIQSLDGVRYDDDSPPVVLYQDPTQEAGEPSIRYDTSRELYVVRMALALNVNRIAFEPGGAIGLSTQKLGDAAYRMHAPTFARSFSRLIGLRQLPLPLSDAKAVFPLRFPRHGPTAPGSGPRSWLVHAFAAGERSALDATSSAFSRRGLSFGSPWQRFTSRFGLWEAYGLVYARTNVVLSRSSGAYVPLEKVPKRRESIYVRTAGPTWDPDIGDMLEDHDFSLVGSGAIETRPIRGKGLGNIATRPLLAGTLIEEYTGEVLSISERTLKGSEKTAAPHFEFAAEMESVIAEGGRRIGLLVDADDVGNASRFFNHTCYPRGSKGMGHYAIPGPNADLLALWHIDMLREGRGGGGGDKVNGRRRVMIMTMRDVIEGEEITVNYGKNYEIDRCLCDVCK